MSDRTIRSIGIGIVVAVALALSAFLLKPKREAIPPSMTMEFSHSLAHGLVMGDGTYVVYSLGEEVNPTLVGLSADKSTHYVEFPLKTSDGRTVYGMFFIVGQIQNQNLVAGAFERNGKERGILINYIPAYLYSQMQALVAKYPYTAFGENQHEARQDVSTEVIAGLTPVFRDLGFNPKSITVLVYPP